MPASRHAWLVVVLPCLGACGGLIDTGPEGIPDAGIGDVPPPSDVPIEEKRLKWMRQFGSAGQDKASAVAFAASGSVLLAGWTSLGEQDPAGGLGKTDSFVRRYDASGEVEWARQFGTTDSDGVYAGIGQGEDFVVAGYCRGALPGEVSLGESDAYVSRLLGDGSVAWTRQFGSAGHDVAYSIAEGQNGGFLVAGYVEQALPGQASAGAEDAFWAKFDREGRLELTHQFGSSLPDVAFAVCTHHDGGWTVAGSTAGTLAGVNLGKEDAFFLRFDAAGQLTLARQFGGPSKDAASSVACLADGSIVVGGYFFGELEGELSLGSYDGFVRRYDRTGHLVYSRLIGSEGTDYVHALAVDAFGHVFVAGSTEGLLAEPMGGGRSDSYVITLDGAGSEIAGWQFGSPELGEARSIAVSASGRVAAAGYSQGALPGQVASGAVDAYVAILE